ncbi:MAG: hypothetical protein CSA23_06275 [Deltaproteobacteria bacterium]|nr:MAG: hypothetical protein CSA23_06275 [Deltaproteobacteria bacterium]
MAAFIKFSDIEGEAKDAKHEGWSDLASFSQAITKPGAGMTGQSRRRGDAIAEDLVCSKELDKASPKIAEKCLNGKIFDTVQIEMTASISDEGRQTYLAYEMKKVMVTSYNVSGVGQGEQVPMEDFTLNFEEIKVTYTEYDASGTKKGDLPYTWKVEESTT